MSLIDGGYYVEVSDSEGGNVIWEVVENNVVEVSKKNDEIGLRGFYFYFCEEQWGEKRKGLSDYPYLFMLIEL